MSWHTDDCSHNTVNINRFLKKSFIIAFSSSPGVWQLWLKAALLLHVWNTERQDVSCSSKSCVGLLHNGLHSWNRARNEGETGKWKLQPSAGGLSWLCVHTMRKEEPVEIDCLYSTQKESVFIIHENMSPYLVSFCGVLRCVHAGWSPHDQTFVTLH